MIKNGKYFVHPDGKGRDFKELFRYLASSGVGRPVDAEGFSAGPWSAELLASAITEFDPSGAGIELRTVQLWFQDNENGISSDNVRWLARIFGCGDPEATSEWQAELSAARAKFLAKRRERRNNKVGQIQLDKSEVLPASRPDILSATNIEAEGDIYMGPQERRFSLVASTEAILGGAPLNVPTFVFAGSVALCFAAYFLEMHQMTYEATREQLKQIGFLWAPNWTLLFIVFMPLFFVEFSGLLLFWKEEGRNLVVVHSTRADSANAWRHKIESSTYSFWAALLVCIFFAGVFQWVGVRLLPLIRGGGQHATDWGSIAIVRPDIVSVPEVIAFTGFAYLYMSICFYMFFASLIFMCCFAQDYGEMCEASREVEDIPYRNGVRFVAAKLQRGIFRCTVLAIFVAVCMKLQSTYLASTGTDIIRWLISDMKSIFVPNGRLEVFGEYSAPNHFSSLLIVLAAVFVFLHSASCLGPKNICTYWSMLLTVGLLTTAFLLIGVFTGFSMLLGIAALIGIYSLIDPGFGTGKPEYLRGDGVVS